MDEHTVNALQTEEDELITIPEAAERIGVKPYAVRKAVDRKRIPATHKYGRTLVTLADVKAYYESVKMGRPKKFSDAPEGNE